MRRIDEYTDREIAAALLARNEYVTHKYLYEKCFPLFDSIFHRYYTDCDSTQEFIHAIYLYLLEPKAESNVCRIEEFGFKCTLTIWLKIVTERYCSQLYQRRLEVFSFEESTLDTSRILSDEGIMHLNIEDAKKVLDMMPNSRYRELISLRYLEGNTNEETAKTLNVSMANYYNLHLRAKLQLLNALKKDGLI